MTISFEHLVGEYKQTKKYIRLAFNSKLAYDDALSTLRRYFNLDDVRDIKRIDIIEMRDHLYDQPGKLKIALSVLNNLLTVAYNKGWVEYNHAKNVDDLPAGKPFARWEAVEIDTLFKFAPKRIKDILMLALYTGQRRSDLIKMRWTDYDGKTIYCKQVKTGREVWIPVHPKLRRYLMTIGRDSAYILSPAREPAWIGESMRAAFKSECKRVGLGAKTLHGLRKTTGAILAECGCTPHEIMSILGHSSLKEAQRYTEEAERKRLAQSAMGKWINAA